MRKTVRKGVFETNSSNTHVMTICLAEDFEKWNNGEVLLNVEKDEFLPVAEGRAENLKLLEGEEKSRYESGESLGDILGYDLKDFYITPEDYDTYYGDCLEWFSQTKLFTNKEGVQSVVAFGYSGRNS